MNDNNTNQGAVITQEEIILSEYHKIINKYPDDDWLNPEVAMKEAHTMEMVTNCMKEYAAPYISKLKEKEQEIEEWQKDYSDLQNRNIELKAKADKLYEALSLNQDYVNMKNEIPEFRKKHIISAGLHSSEYVSSQTEQALSAYQQTNENK